MYPIKFENIYFEKVWGGRRLCKFRSNVPDGKIGESWDISCHENGMGVVQNGKYKGFTFDKLIEKYGDDILGNKVSKNSFPLLVKLISADTNLSVQVHPDDEYARKNENSVGKNECWYVLDAKDDAELIIGTKNCDKEKFRKAIEEGNVYDYLNVKKIKKGDMFFIESGLVHAICGGVTIAEIQQSSDITYRVYDYNRGRELHIDKALDVINFSLEGKNIKGKLEQYDKFNRTILCRSSYFNIDKYDVFEEIEDRSSEDTFFLLTCIDGNGQIISNEDIIDIKMGDSILIPAKLGKYILKGKISFLKTFI